MVKALILVGGYGTRLRPLTFTMPKPLVPFANKPMVIHQIEALKQVGVDEVVLAVGYNPDIMKSEMDKWSKELNIKISYSQEKTPMGTAGPLALAKDILTADGNEMFFVFNSDINCTFPLQALMDFHKQHGKEGTILVKQVKDPSKYGVVVFDEKTGQISRFVEKPQEWVGDRINAGLYLFNKAILDRIPPKNTSIERVIFPQMAAEGNLYAKDIGGFWMDVGQPKDYLTGMCLHLEHQRLLKSTALVEQPKDGSYKIEGDVMIGKNVTIGRGCVIGPNVVIGDNCVIEDGVRLKRSALFSNVKIGASSLIVSSIIGWNSKIGRWTRLENVTVIGENCQIADELILDEISVLPHKEVKATPKPGSILM